MPHDTPAPPQTEAAEIVDEAMTAFRTHFGDLFSPYEYDEMARLLGEVLEGFGHD